METLYDCLDVSTTKAWPIVKAGILKLTKERLRGSTSLTETTCPFNQFHKSLLRLSHFPTSWKEALVVTLPKPDEDPKFSQNLRPISLLSSTGKFFENVILEIVKRPQVSLASVHVTARHSNV
jgi:hypothetical protein